MRFLIAVLFTLIAAPALAQNPCATPPTNTVLGANGANEFYALLPDFTRTLPDGTSTVLAYQYAVWPDGADPATTAPAQGPTTLPKSAFTPVPTFADCYKLTGGLPGLIPQQNRMFAGLRSQGQPNAQQQFTSWSTSNSFSLASTPVNPAAPGQIRIVRPSSQ